MRPSSWCAVFVTWDDRCAGAWGSARARAGGAMLAGDGAWAGVGARAGAATLAGDGAWAGARARAGAAMLAGDGAWAAGAGTAGLQYLNRLCCAGGLVTGAGEGATRG